jgi:hypothetical protein
VPEVPPQARTNCEKGNEMNDAVKDETVIHVPQTFQRRPGALNTLPPDANPMAMLAMAVANNWEPERLRQLMDLNDRFMADQARQAFNEAFAAFKSEAVTVIKNRKVDAGPLAGKRYAELFSVVNAITPALSKHGLSASWKITKDEKDWIEVTCIVKHAKGHSESVTMGGPPDVGGAKSPIQARASTVSYLERYTLKAVCGVAEEGDDSDGNGSGGGKKGVEPDEAGKAILEKCASHDSLKKAWAGLTAEQRGTLSDVMTACKKRITEADKA